MTQSTMLRTLALLLWSSVAAAQATLGDLLAANATKISPEQFNQEVAQRRLTGPTPTGGTIELMYLGNGSLQGSHSAPTDAFGYGNPLEGRWTTDDTGRICTAIRMSGGPRMATAVVTPPRCEFWFKLGDRYFIAISDYDRSARVLERRVVTVSTPAAATRLGQLLDAGAKPLSGSEFRDQIVQRVLAGTTPSGAQIEIMYAASGAIVGTGYEPGDYRRLGIDGKWSIDDKDRICARVRMGGAGPPTANLPVHCEFWFKVGDNYYLSDSNQDRSAKLLVRSVKQ